MKKVQFIIFFALAIIISACAPKPCNEQNKAWFIADVDSLAQKLKSLNAAPGRSPEFISSVKSIRDQAARVDAPSCAVDVKNMLVSLYDETIAALEGRSNGENAYQLSYQFDAAYGAFKQAPISNIAIQQNNPQLIWLFVGGGVLVLIFLVLGIMLLLRPAKTTEPVLNPSTPSDTNLYPNVPARKRQGLLDRPADWVALVLLILAGIWIITSLTGVTPIDTSVIPNPLNAAHRITIKVTGSGAASLTYFNASGGMEQHTVGLPFQVEYMLDSFKPVSISAQKQQENGVIACEVLDNGSAWLHASASTPYGIAMCTGWVGQK